MEKIRLKNAQEFEVLPMGINFDAHNKARRFDLIAELSYAELEEILLNEDNLKVIQHLSATDEVLATYTDCIALKSITKERGKYITDNTTLHDVFTVVLSTDATATKIRALEEENGLVKQEVTDLKELVDTLVISTLEV